MAISTASVATAMHSVAQQTFMVSEGKDKKVEAEATAEVMALVRRSVDLRKRENALKAEREEIRDLLGDIMASDGIDRIVHQGTIHVTRAVTTPARIDTKSLRENYPDLAEALTVIGEPEQRITVK